MTRNKKHNRVRYLQRKYESPDTNMKRYRKSTYKMFVDIVHTNYSLNPYQKVRSKRIIDCVDFRKIYRNERWELIVLGICFFVMSESGWSLDFSSGLALELGLSRDRYNVIERNIRMQECV